MENSQVYLSSHLEEQLEGTLSSKKIEFIKALCRFIFESNIEKKLVVEDCISNSKYFTLSSNSEKTFCQVGGNPIFAIIVSAFQKYSTIKYIGSLTAEYQDKVNMVHDFFISYNFNAKIEFDSSCTYFSNAVIIIIDESLLTVSLENYVINCEVYLRKNLARNFTLISKDIFIRYDKKLYLVCSIQLSNIEHFELFKVLSIKSKKIDDLHKIIHKLPKVNVDENEISTIINNLHQAYLASNISSILEGFCSLMYQITLELRGNIKKYRLVLFQFLTLLNQGFFLWSVHFILFRTDLSSFCVSLMYESIMIKNFNDALICLLTIHTLTTKNTEWMRDCLIESFKNIQENAEEVKDILSLLDNEQQSELSQEISNFIELFPEKILIHSSDQSFSGKTLLGGIISASVDYLTKNEKISRAALLLILRHETCHKKWLIKGSRNEFDRDTPPFGQDNIQEAGFLLDRVMYGPIKPSEKLRMKGLTENVADKIIKGNRLSAEELELLFVDDSNTGIKAMRNNNIGNLKYFCTGRPSRKIINRY